MVSDNQLDQYFQLVKDKLLEKDISEPFCMPCYIKKSMQGLDKVMQMIIANIVGLYYLRSVRCRCDLSSDLFPVTPEQVTMFYMLHLYRLQIFD